MKRKVKISFNSPVVLWFSVISLAALIIGAITQGASTRLLFSVYRSSLENPLTYVRFIGHVFGHANWSHFIGNIMLLLVVGPMLEEKYGSSNILFVILATALVTGIVNFIFFPHVQLLGASGVVFAFILLSSFTSIREGTIPARATLRSSVSSIFAVPLNSSTTESSTLEPVAISIAAMTVRLPPSLQERAEPNIFFARKRLAGLTMPGRLRPC